MTELEQAQLEQTRKQLTDLEKSVIRMLGSAADEAMMDIDRAQSFVDAVNAGLAKDFEGAKALQEQYFELRMDAAYRALSEYRRCSGAFDFGGTDAINETRKRHMQQIEERYSTLRDAAFKTLEILHNKEK